MKQRIITFDDREVELYDELELKDAPDIYIYEEDVNMSLKEFLLNMNL